MELDAGKKTGLSQRGIRAMVTGLDRNEIDLLNKETLHERIWRFFR